MCSSQQRGLGDDGKGPDTAGERGIRPGERATTGWTDRERDGGLRIPYTFLLVMVCLLALHTSPYLPCPAQENTLSKMRLSSGGGCFPTRTRDK